MDVKASASVVAIHEILGSAVVSLWKVLGVIFDDVMWCVHVSYEVDKGAKAELNCPWVCCCWILESAPKGLGNIADVVNDGFYLSFRRIPSICNVGSVGKVPNAHCFDVAVVFEVVLPGSDFGHCGGWQTVTSHSLADGFKLGGGKVGFGNRCDELVGMSPPAESAEKRNSKHESNSIDK